MGNWGYNPILVEVITPLITGFPGPTKNRPEVKPLAGDNDRPEGRA